MIYFVEAVGLNLVKIGFTEKEPALRFSKMIADSPVELCIIATLEGSTKDEDKIHNALGEFLVRGEWYALTEKVRAFIDETTNPYVKKPAKRDLTIRIAAACADSQSSAPLALLKFRERLDIRQTKLAEMLGVTKATMSRYEAGIKQIPAERVLDIERATGIPRHELRPDIYPPTPAPSQAEVA